MFDMVETGKRLAKFRRSANFTQMEVAEQLGISFQAVSYWERGKTMPDISNLVKIAILYDVSIDSILDNEKQSSAVHQIMEKKNSVDLLEIVPIMKPDDISKTIENAQVNVDDFRMIIDSAPFLDEQTLSRLAIENSGLITSFKDVCRIASYIDCESMESLCLKHSDKANFTQICEIACRVGKKCISELVMRHINDTVSFSQICILACYLEKETLCRLTYINSQKAENFTQIVNLACFLDRQTIDRLVEVNCDKAESFEQISPMACFLSHNILAKLCIENADKEIDDKQLKNVSYYLEDGELECFMKLIK